LTARSRKTRTLNNWEEFKDEVKIRRNHILGKKKKKLYMT